MNSAPEVFREDFHIDYEAFSAQMDALVSEGGFEEVAGFETQIDHAHLPQIQSLESYDPHNGKNPVIRLRDVTAREADQAGGAFQYWIKDLIIRGLIRSGIQDIEAGFACDADLEACRNAPAKFQSATISLLTISDTNGEGRTITLDDGTKVFIPNYIDLGHEYLSSHPDPVLHIFFPTQDHHAAAEIDRKGEMTLEQIREKVCERVAATVSHASSKMRVEWSPEIGVDTEPQFLLQTVRIAIQNGASIINVPDTRGGSDEKYIEKLFKFLHWGTRDLEEEHDFVFSCHNHNDRGNAVNNSLAAVRGGATDVEVTLAKLWEWAGNAGTHRTLVELKRAGYEIVWDPDIHTISRLEELVLDTVHNETVAPYSARAGQDGAGVHKARHWNHLERSKKVGSDPGNSFYRDGQEFCRPRRIIEIQNLGGRDQIVESLKLFGIHHKKSDPQIGALYTFFCNSTKTGAGGEKEFNLGETTHIQRAYPHNVYSMYQKMFHQTSIGPVKKNGVSGFKVPIIKDGKIVHEFDIVTTQDQGAIPATISALEKFLWKKISLTDEHSNALPNRNALIAKYRDIFPDLESDGHDLEDGECYAETHIHVAGEWAQHPARISRVRGDVIEQTYAVALIESCMDLIVDKIHVDSMT